MQDQQPKLKTFEAIQDEDLTAAPASLFTACTESARE